MKLTFDIFKIIGAKIKKIIWFLGVNAFAFVLVLIVVDFIIGGFIFYKDVFLAERKEPNVAGILLKFDTKSYQEVLRKLQNIEGAIK